LSRSLPIYVLSALLLAASVLPAGVITQVNSRGALPPEDSVQWGTLADEGLSKTSPYVVSSVGGITVTASLSQGFLVFVQGSSYGGDFAGNDIIMETDWTGGNVSGPLSINFSSLISGVGFQIQRSILGQAFTGTMRAYDNSNVQMGSAISINGTSGTAGNGSALFVGLASSLADIRRIEVEVSNGVASLDNSFAINFASLRVAAPDPGNVPEPTTVGLVGVALALAAWKRSRS